MPSTRHLQRRITAKTNAVAMGDDPDDIDFTDPEAVAAYIPEGYDKWHRIKRATIMGAVVFSILSAIHIAFSLPAVLCVVTLKPIIAKTHRVTRTLPDDS